MTDNGAVVAAVTVPVVLILIFVLTVIIVIIVFIIKSRRKKTHEDVIPEMEKVNILDASHIRGHDDSQAIDPNIEELSSQKNSEAKTITVTVRKDPEHLQVNDQTYPLVEGKVANDREVHQSLMEEKSEVSTETEVQQNPMVEKQVITDSELDPGTQQKPMAAEEGANTIQQNDGPMAEENRSYDDKQNPEIEEKAPIDAKTTDELQLTNCIGDQMFDKPTNTETSSSRMQYSMLPVKEDKKYYDDVI